MKAVRSAKASERAAPQRSTESEGRELILAWQSSGLSVADFCRDRGIPAHRVHYWKRRLSGASSPQKDAVAEFFTVQVEPESMKGPSADRTVASIQIWASDSVRVELSADTPREDFVRTVRWVVEAMQP